MATHVIRVEVVAEVEADSPEEARALFWGADALSHYINGVDVITDAREVEAVS